MCGFRLSCHRDATPVPCRAKAARVSLAIESPALLHLAFRAQTVLSRIRWAIGVTSIGLSISAPVVAADVPGLAYRPAIGCPTRESFAEELLRRMSFRAPRSDKS